MASYTLTVSGARGQKLARQTTSTTEDTYTVSMPSVTGDPFFNLQIQPSTASALYFDGSASGQTQSNGWPIPLGAALTIQVGPGTKFYLSATAGGTVDFLIV